MGSEFTSISLIQMTKKWRYARRSAKSIRHPPFERLGRTTTNRILVGELKMGESITAGINGMQRMRFFEYADGSVSRSASDY
ncbi:hypothetical protein G7047_21665 [Diaphorobacter sp. HDW4A]|uniref:hypothetical protein n=1 Tax=Diaphorobacter sp. HDW4A TaxID=2714924 RepID=UPI00140D2617|nr:hypothetical protein [Diaphorobacter sp. HDW4A]QIL82249.1 hypothetical protein G7047_21665 [Diaphorobacter sp. HDW4A]